MPFGRSWIRRHPSWYLGLGTLFVISVYYLSRNYTSLNKASSVNLKYLLAAAIRAAENGGVQILRHSHSFSLKSKGKTAEGAEQYVTDADFKSHCAMFHSLNDIFPSVEIISEESSVSKECPTSEYHSFQDLEPFIQRELLKLPDDIHISSEDITVWIDPLDATQEFTEHLTQYVTTMVCVAVKGLPVIGVIHKPFVNDTNDKSGRTFWSWLPIAVSHNLKTYTKNLKDVAPDSPNIIISRSHAGSIAKKLENVFTKSYVTAAGGAGYKVLELVKGKATVYVHTTKIKKWDICAGNVILKAIGGEMTTLTNKPINYTFELGEVNDEGILASVINHDKYYEIFRNVLKTS